MILALKLCHTQVLDVSRCTAVCTCSTLAWPSWNNAYASSSPITKDRPQKARQRQEVRCIQTYTAYAGFIWQRTICGLPINTKCWWSQAEQCVQPGNPYSASFNTGNNIVSAGLQQLLVSVGTICRCNLDMPSSPGIGETAMKQTHVHEHCYCTS